MTDTAESTHNMEDFFKTISTSPVATPSLDDDLNGSHQSLVLAQHVEPLSSNVNKRKHHTAVKERRLQVTPSGEEDECTSTDMDHILPDTNIPASSEPATSQGYKVKPYIMRRKENFDVGEVRSLIEKISCQAEEVERRHGAILSSPNQDKRKKDKLELLNNDIKKNANVVRVKLKSMQENLPVDENSRGASVIQRIQKNQHSHLTRCFAEVMKGHHKAQISFREKCKAQIQRQLEIVDKVTTDEELEEMLHRDNLAIFISDVSSDARFSSQALSEIESRHQDIISLESSIRELHEIFADTAMLLEIQGELINNIEKNVTSAAEYVDKSKAETYKAVTYKKNPHKIASLPSFFKPFKRKTTATDQNTSDLNHD